MGSKNNAIVSIENNKLVFSDEALILMDANPGDRISIEYYTVDSEETFPVIGKSELFTDKTGGNRLTKSNTVSFRGIQREILLEYGEQFELEKFNNYFKMTKIEKIPENDDLREEESDLEKLK